MHGYRSERLIGRENLVDELTYSVMQSDGNNFCGDLVSDGFNMSYRDEDSISEQKCEKQISWDLYHKDFIF